MVVAVKLSNLLPNWLKELAAACTEKERQSLKINTDCPLCYSPTIYIMVTSSEGLALGEKKMRTMTNPVEFAKIHAGTKEFNKIKTNMEMRRFMSSYGFRATTEEAVAMFKLRDAA